MSPFSQIISFPILTVAATVESFFAVKLLADSYSLRERGYVVAGVFLANYGFLLFFWVVVYPIFLSPLCRLPGPKVTRL
jgi:hypothetical protein